MSTHATLFVVHGANMTATDVADLEETIRREVIARGLPADNVVVPRWRDSAGVFLGPASLTLPHKPGDAPRWQFLWTMVSRVAGRKPIASMVTDAATRFRPELMNRVGYQLLGDVVAYTRNRDRIHTVLRDVLSGCGNDVVAVGHSLGGVALVDLMAERPAQNVRSLVTVGSQAPFLYTLDALVGLPYGGKPFTPWINVWDSRDHLSFFARDVFKLRRDDTWPILDVEVASDQPIRDAHSAYWDQAGTWAAIELAFRTGLGQQSLFDVHTTGEELVQIATKIRDSEKADRRAFVEAWLDNAQAASRLLMSETRLVLQNIKKTAAEYDLHLIQRGSIPRRQVEQTGALYFDVDGAPYAFTFGTIDSARVKRLEVEYGPLRPTGWTADNAPWLVVFAEKSSTVTDQTGKALREAGIITLILDEEASNRFQTLLATQ